MAKRTTELNFSAPKSYASLIYGSLTVVVIFLILFFGIRSIQQRNASITPSAEETTAVSEHQVKEGDSLWTIAEQQYNDGFKWTEIAKANNLENPDAIEVGMILKVPSLSETPAEEQATTETNESTAIAGDKITGDSYKIAEGDNLWDISVRAYGDGYKWPELAKTNNLENPDLIYPEDTVKLPR